MIQLMYSITLAEVVLGYCTGMSHTPGAFDRLSQTWLRKWSTCLTFGAREY